MNKFQRILWTINGVLFLLTFVGFGGAFVIHNWDKSSREGGIFESSGQGNSDSLKLAYDIPIKISESGDFLLPILSRNFIGEYGDGAYTDKIINVIFIGDHFRKTTKLLDSSSFIFRIKYSNNRDFELYSDAGTLDTAINKVLYVIASKDSNKDGILDNQDFTDLFISNTDGSALLQITENIEPIDYEFVSPNEIWIQYQERDGQKKVLLAVYFIKEKRIQKLTEADQMVRQIEKSLIK